MVVAMDTAASGPALPAEPRPVHESAPLPSDYPAWRGVPQCLAAATEPMEIAPSVWEVQAGLPMEAFWCTSGPPQVTQYNFTHHTRNHFPHPLPRVLGYCYGDRLPHPFTV